MTIDERLKSRDDYTSFVIRMISVLKENFKDIRISLEGNDSIIIDFSDSRNTMLLYPLKYFARYAGGESLEDIDTALCDSVRATMQASETGRFSMSYKEAIKDIVPKFVNKNFNASQLKDSARINLKGDVSVIFTCLIKEKEDEIIAFSVPEKKLDEWHVSIEKLIKDSLRTAEKRLPAEIMPIQDAIDRDPGESGPEFYVASNIKKINGADVILYKDTMKDFAEKHGSFYAVPSSVHEMLLWPEDEVKPDILLEQMKDINRSTVSPEEILSDTNIYHYDAESDRLSVIVSGQDMGNIY